MLSVEQALAHGAASAKDTVFDISDRGLLGLGDLVIRNQHGQREPWQTRAWVAATSHLFDLALERPRNNGDEATLRSLVTLVEEVDDRIDEFVAFEDSCACDELSCSLETARTLLGET